MTEPPRPGDHYYEGDLTIGVVQTVDELLERCKMTDRTILACAMAPTGDCLSITTATARPTLRSTRSPIRKSGCGSSAIAGEEVAERSLGSCNGAEGLLSMPLGCYSVVKEPRCRHEPSQ